MRKKTIGEVRKFVESQGYELLSEEYVNNSTKLKFRCPKGHEFWMGWNDFQQGIRCSSCAGLKKKTIEEIREFVKSQNYELLSEKYMNNRTKMEFRCPFGHEFEMTWSDFHHGCRCSTCKGINYSINMSGSNSPNWKGGIQYNPYCSNWADQDYKQSLIKDRDGNKCLNHDCWHTADHLPLELHHLNYNRQACNPWDLITVCRSCNSRANFEREWHQAWYQAIMYRRYGYVY